MKYLLLCELILIISGNLFSQTVEQVKADNLNYYWGEGSGTTLEITDAEALDMLISQISTTVQDNTVIIKEESGTEYKGKVINLEGKEQVPTPNTINNLLISEYKVQLSKQGFGTVSRQITIEEGKITMLKEILPSTASPNIEEDKITISKKPNVINKVPKEIVKSNSTEYYKYKKMKSLWLVSALVTGATGTVSYYQAKSASDQYKTATTDAEDLYKKIELYNMISPIAFGVAGFCAIEFILTSGKQAKARKLPLSFYPVPRKNGGGLGLTYNF